MSEKLSKDPLAVGAIAVGLLWLLVLLVHGPTGCAKIWIDEPGSTSWFNSATERSLRDAEREVASAEMEYQHQLSSRSEWQQPGDVQAAKEKVAAARRKQKDLQARSDKEQEQIGKAKAEQAAAYRSSLRSLEFTFAIVVVGLGVVSLVASMRRKAGSG